MPLYLMTAAADVHIENLDELGLMFCLRFILLY